jgi:hypothetical protein
MTPFHSRERVVGGRAWQVMRQGRDVRPCEESDRTVREALGDRLVQIVAKRMELEDRLEAIEAGGTLLCLGP